MEFQLNDEQQAIRDEVRRLCTRFDDNYWREHDRDHAFPEEFFRAMADGGWLGIAIPEAYGGSGRGITEAALMMQEIAASGACASGVTGINVNVFGVNPLAKHGSEEQRTQHLPRVARGEVKVCFGVTEPEAGLNTTMLKTRAVRQGDHYVVNGQKVWISTAQVADKILLLTRTTPLEEVKRPTDGLTLFYTDINREAMDIREIDKAGRAAVDSNEIFIENLHIPETDRVGEEGRGFYYLLDGLNPERVLVSAQCLGIGQAALRKASQYAKDRVVFGRPIGQNQAIQHPLADSWAKLQAAELLTYKAAWLYDNGLPCGPEANAAKLLAAEWGWLTADRAMQVHGGMGYSKEFHVERYWREAKIYRLAPISPELILSFIAERVLGLPKSY